MTSAELAIESRTTGTDSPDQTRQRLAKGARRILVVDDEPMIRELMADYLRENGFPSETAHSGEEALKRLKREEFSLLVTDMSMPGISGLDLLSYVANNCPDMAVIVITAIYELGTAVDSMKLGAYDYIT